MYKARKIVLLALIFLSLSGVVRAQKPMVGAFSSPKGFGLCANLPATNGSCMHDLSVYADMFNHLAGYEGRIGATANYAYLSIYNKLDFEDFDCYFVAGPGLSLGYCSDYQKEDLGAVGALTGTAGILMDFDRRVSINISMTSKFGMQLLKNGNGKLDLSFYKYGVLQTLLPQISIYIRL